jgi:hypothetical protein
LAELSTLGGVIKTAYEGESDTNAFTDAEKSKLSGVSPGANNYTLPDASGLTRGGVLQGSAVSDATDDTDVVAQLNALLASLRASGAIGTE